MATRNNKSTNTSTNNEVQTKKVGNITFGILRTNTTKNGNTFFDIIINGVTIYGCVIVDSAAGSFVSFPAKEGKDGKWYKHVYIKLSDEEEQAVIDAVDSFGK